MTPVTNNSNSPRQSGLDSTKRQAVHLTRWILREIVLLSNADTVLKMQEAAEMRSPRTGALTESDLREVIRALTDADLARINQHQPSSIDLYRSGSHISSITNDINAQKTLAKNANISPSLEHYFAASKDVAVRASLAEKPGATDLQIWRTLAGDTDDFVRFNLASNNSLFDTEIQRILAVDRDIYVREALAGNTSVVHDIQIKLTNDQDPKVRDALANNISVVNPEVQLALANDRNVFVRESLARNGTLIDPNVQRALAGDTDSRVQLALAGNRTLTDLQAQRALASATDMNVQLALANNCNLTDPEIQQILLRNIGLSAGRSD